jgi:hypothetical protein
LRHLLKSLKWSNIIELVKQCENVFSDKKMFKKLKTKLPVHFEQKNLAGVIQAKTYCGCCLAATSALSYI